MEKILIDKRLKVLAENREAHYKSLKKNHDHSHSIIGEQLYSKQSHFIFELLQNAEDEKARKVKITLYSEKIVFEHNGRPFDIDDIEAITSFGNNERKKLKPNAIGRFGIGFKSVFSVTENPEIQSGNFQFSISNFIVPKIKPKVKTISTIITLPFKKLIGDDIFTKISTTLDELDSSYLLFLSNLKEIEIVNVNKEETRLIKLNRTKYKKSDLKILTISEGSKLKEFLLFESIVSISKKTLPIKIAFAITRKAKKIEFEPLESSPLFAFFATEKETNLPFYIHAPFLTTPPRDNIISDDQRNKKLFIALTDLLVKSIEKLKILSIIDLNTWLVFPCNISFYKNEIYKMFCDVFFKYLLNKNTLILPSDDFSYCHVHNAMKIKDKELKYLITQKEAKALFGRNQWVTQNISKTKYKVIENWIEQQYKVPSIGLKEFCEKVDNSFFIHKPDIWLLKFYQSICDSSELWRAANRGISAGPLRNKAFIRTSKNKSVIPFDSQGKLNVYLPSEGTTDYQFIKSIFLADKDSKKLFKSLNITKPDLIAEVNEHIIPRILKATLPYRGIKNDIQKIFKAIRKSDEGEGDLLIKRLKLIRWLLGKNNLTKKINLHKPDELYFPTKELVHFLGKTSTATFLDIEIFADNKSRTMARPILDEVGVYFRPRRFYRHSDDIIFEKRNEHIASLWNNKNIELEGLRQFLKSKVDKKESLILWNILVKSREHWKVSGFVNTMFIQELKDTRWLFNKFGQRYKPSELTPNELDEAYDTSNELVSILEFKPDVLREFELEHNVKILSYDELQMMKIEMDLLKKENERLKNLYEPIITGNENEDNLPNIDEVQLGNELTQKDIQIFDDIIPEDHQTDNYLNFEGNGSNGGMISFGPSKRQKNIGSRGEEYVLKLLRENFKSNDAIEIKDLNEDDKLGVGCDIIVSKDSIAVTFIEVKSTEGGYDNKFKISEKQWRTAIKSHLDNNEPEYHIYCVYYAGSTTPQHIIIKDPVNWMLKNQLRFVEQWFNVRRIQS